MKYYKGTHVCPKCKKEHDGRHLRCEECLKRDRERKRGYREKRASEGLCVTCGKNPPAPGRKNCSECLRDDKETREALKSLHICVSCRIRTAAPNRIRCEYCLAKKAEIMAKKRDNPAEWEKIKAYKKEHYYSNKQNGLCVICGGPVTDGKARCPKCRRKDSKRHRKSYVKMHPIPRDEWVGEGLCYRCGKKPALPGLHSCQQCRDIQMRSLSFGEEGRRLQRQKIRLTGGYFGRKNTCYPTVSDGHSVSVTDVTANKGSD